MSKQVTKTRRDFETRYKPTHPEPLSRKVMGAKVPIEVERIVESCIPKEERAEWLRNVITEAARKLEETTN